MCPAGASSPEILLLTPAAISSRLAPPHNRTATQVRSARSAHNPLAFRKEVIQPHLPIRLPCYDFTPVAGFAFDRSLPRGLGHGLRALPTPMV